jgi:hypothetical protein
MYKKDLEREEAKKVIIQKISLDQGLDQDQMKEISLSYLKR